MNVVNNCFLCDVYKELRNLNRTQITDEWYYDKWKTLYLPKNSCYRFRTFKTEFQVYFQRNMYRNINTFLSLGRWNVTVLENFSHTQLHLKRILQQINKLTDGVSTLYSWIHNVYVLIAQIQYKNTLVPFENTKLLVTKMSQDALM